MEELRSEIGRLAAAVPGRVSVSICWPRSGSRLSLRGRLLQPTASLIKLPILCHVLMACEEGSVQLDEIVRLSDHDRVPGSGVLKELSSGLELTVRDLCVLMTIQSDNTATNMLLDRVGVRNVNRRMRSLGLARTTLFRRVYRPDENRSALCLRYGLGASTADEMTTLLQYVCTGKLGRPETAQSVWSILGAQQLRDGIPRRLPDGVTYAGKSGAVDSVRNDAGILSLPDGTMIAIAILCDRMPVLPYTADHPALVAMASIARLAVESSLGGGPCQVGGIQQS